MTNYSSMVQLAPIISVAQIFISTMLYRKLMKLYLHLGFTLFFLINPWGTYIYQDYMCLSGTLVDCCSIFYRKYKQWMELTTYF